MKSTPLSEFIQTALDSLDLAVSIIDAGGTLLYYNRQAAAILNRKPRFIGTDIHTHHQPPTNEKLDQMLADFKSGRTAPIHYEARPYGKVIAVTLIPLIVNQQFVGCVQSVRLQSEPTSEKNSSTLND